MTHKEYMWFSRYLSLWDCQCSGVSARYEFRRSMAPNSPWISSCAQGNLRHITSSRSIPVIDSHHLDPKLYNVVTWYTRKNFYIYWTLVENIKLLFLNFNSFIMLQIGFSKMFLFLLVLLYFFIITFKLVLISFKIKSCLASSIGRACDS